MPKVNYSFDLGNIITIGLLLVTSAVSWGNLSARLTALETEVRELRDLPVKIAQLQQEMIDRTGGPVRGYAIR